MVVRRTGFVNVAPSTDFRKEEWQDGARCANAPEADKTMFTGQPDRRTAIELNRQYCSVCPVTRLCLDWAFNELNFSGIAGGSIFSEDHAAGRRRRTVKIPEA